jgi:hypothetical protein
MSQEDDQTLREKILSSLKVNDTLNNILVQDTSISRIERISKITSEVYKTTNLDAQEKDRILKFAIVLTNWLKNGCHELVLSFSQDDRKKYLEKILHDMRANLNSPSIETIDGLVDQSNIGFLRERGGIDCLLRAMSQRGHYEPNVYRASTTLRNMHKRGLLKDSDNFLIAAVSSINQGVVDDPTRRRFISQEQARQWVEDKNKRIRIDYFNTIKSVVPLLAELGFRDINLIKESLDKTLLPEMKAAMQLEKEAEIKYAREQRDIREKKQQEQLRFRLLPIRVVRETKRLKPRGRHAVVLALEEMLKFEPTRMYLEQNTAIQRWLGNSDNFSTDLTIEIRQLRSGNLTFNFVKTFYDITIFHNK